MLCSAMLCYAMLCSFTKCTFGLDKLFVIQSFSLSFSLFLALCFFSTQFIPLCYPDKFTYYSSGGSFG